MLVNNKYNIGDEVYYIDEKYNRVIKGRIIRLHFDSRGVRYDIDTDGFFSEEIEYAQERFIWKSVEECKQYIIDNIEDIFYFR